MTLALRTGAVGSVVGGQQVDVSFRMTAAYAAAIGAEDDLYLDDGVAGGAVAPPAFAVVLEWPLLLRQPYIGLIGLPEARYFEVLLHAFHDTHLHRQTRPGDRLDLVATLTEVRPTAAGALAVCRVETTCARTGEPVTTSWIGSIFRGCAVEGDAAAVANAPALGAPGGLSGPTGEVPIALSRSLPFVYTECSGHWNPIHTQRAYARAAGYADLVVHGTAAWAMASQRLIARFGGGRPERLRRFGARFSGLLLPDTVVTLCHAPATDAAGCVAFCAVDGAANEVLSRGIAEFRP